MRYFNEKNELKLYAVAGTQTVLLSFDINKERLDKENKKNCFIGFSVERKDKKGHIVYLNGSKHFRSLENNPDEKIKNKSLVQTFYWQDYTADPGETYTYTIRPMFGKAPNPISKYESSIKVTTEKLHDGKHSVYFNYGVTGSQAYSKRFDKTPINQLPKKKQQEVLSFLGRDLWEDGLLHFVRQAKDNNYSIYGDFYEFQCEWFLQELKAAKDRGVVIQLIISGKDEQYLDHTDKRSGIKKYGNESMIKKAGLEDCVIGKRTKPSQPHNKFMILCQNKEAKQVWTGSTNITISGIFGHCNTGHWIDDEGIAGKYLKYWNALKNDPPMGKLAKTCEEIQPDTDLTLLAHGDYVFFSPRDTTTNTKPSVHLQNYANLIDAAKELVCMIFPFNMDDVFAKVYAKDKNYLRLVIFESASDAGDVVSNDMDLKITAGKIYEGSEKGWIKEITTKSVTRAGILYVHNKFFIIDPLSEHPMVLTGSANFSNNSIRNNDENSILSIGNARVADIYLTEFDRLFTHFWPRYLTWLNKNKNINKPQGFSKPLDETGTWYNEYFDQNKYVTKRKNLFKRMHGVKDGS